MKKLIHWIGAIALVLVPSATFAQSAKSVAAPAGFAPLQAPCSVQSDGSCAPLGPANPLPVATNGKQETYNLVAANAASAPQAVYGGAYVFSQVCTGYGSVTLRYRGPDGSTMLTLISKTSADSAGGALVTLASATVVDAAIAGTTGCNVTLSRVP